MSSRNLTAGALLVILIAISFVPLVSAGPGPNDFRFNPFHYNLSQAIWFYVDVKLNASDSVYAAEAEISFDPSMLTAGEVLEGDFFNYDGASTSFPVGVSIDNATGRIYFANTRLNPAVTGVSGDRTLCRIKFLSGTTPGITELEVVNASLSDENFLSLTYSTQKGLRTINMQNGDVDGNCLVNIFDLARVGMAYGTQPGSPYWNQNADLNADGEITIIDLAMVGMHYRERCEPTCTPTTETCNGLDDDCDGQVDEDYGSGGSVTYSGPYSADTGKVLGDSCGTGDCAGGTIVCSVDQTSLSCDTESYASSEICDIVDNDCDGEIDEDFPTLGNSCSVGVGICQSSDSLVCKSDGSGVECDAEAGSPLSEVCNGLDDDCDGSTDEGNPGGGGSCNTGLLGVCSAGTETCSSGSIVCVQDTYSSPEVCDGLDNDCDGLVDEGFDLNTDESNCGTCGNTCVNGDDPTCCSGSCTDIDNDDDNCGECGTVCGSGYYCAEGACVIDSDGDGFTSDVDCDDNDATEFPGQVWYADCDGDGYYRATAVTSCDVGEADALTPCVDVAPPDGGWSHTAGNDCDDEDYLVYPAAPETCDGLDNNCNGQVDEGNPGGGASCDGPDSDLCQEGTYSCTAGSLVCSDTTGSTTDICNGLDDDCDSSSLDGSEDPLAGASCDGPDSDLCNEGTYSCTAGSLTCSDNTGHNLDVCDGADNDCDPASADGSEDSGLGIPCSTGLPGVCSAGTQMCSAGSLFCYPDTSAVPETCDGLDNDCDGPVDEGIIPPPCPLQLGVCYGATKTCAGVSGWQSCTAASYGPFYESTELTCDTLDNDCDGAVDEGGVCGICGDESCDTGEDAGSCPADCPAVCGDTYCTHTEDASSCATDCPAVCGDGFCTHSENSATCPIDCGLFYCFGIASDDPLVCSGHGVCTATDTCSCEEGWTGADCSTLSSWTCNGIPYGDPNVCSAHGVCTEPDTCVCDSGWEGNDCSSSCVDLDEPSTWGTKIEIISDDYYLAEDVTLCKKTYNLNDKSIVSARNNWIHSLDCNGATLVGNMSSNTAVRLTCYDPQPHLPCIASLYVRNCNIESFNSGININHVYGTTVEDNNVTNCNYGISFAGVENGFIMNNRITDTAYTALSVDRDIGSRDSKYNLIEDNYIDTAGQRALFLRESVENTITGNTFSGAGIEGVYVWESANNTIYNNYFDSSTNVNSNVNSFNYWNLPASVGGPNIVGGPLIGGNYWSDYVGADTNSDGLGDTLIPYNTGINGGDGDFMPLVAP